MIDVSWCRSSVIARRERRKPNVERMSSFPRTVVLSCALTSLLVATGCGSVVVAPPPSSHSGAGGEGGASTPASSTSTSGAGTSTGGATPGGATVWSRRFGSDSDESFESFAVSPAGNIALVGNYRHPIDFGGGPLPGTLSNARSIFVVGLDSAGEHVFSHFLEGGEDWTGDAEPLREAAFDPQGNIVIAGFHTGEVGFGCSTLDAKAGDVFLAKLDAKGACLWSKVFPGKLEKRNIHVAVTPSGEIVVAGIFFGNIDFGGDLLDAPGMKNLAKGRMFLARFDAEGKHLWSKRFANASVTGVQIAVDEGGDTFVGGTFYGKVDFGGGPLTSASYGDIYLARLDPAGKQVWSKRLGEAGSNDNVITRVAAVSGGALIVSGAFNGAIDLGTGLIKSSEFNVKFLARFDSDGKHVFSRVFSQSNGFLVVAQVAARSTGEIAFAGDLSDTIGFGGTPLMPQGDWGSDGFVARYDALGHFVWDRGFKCDACAGAVPITPAFDVAGNLFLAGLFSSTFHVAEPPLVSAGERDLFVARLLP